MSLATKLQESLIKRDKYGQELTPGCVCVRVRKNAWPRTNDEPRQNLEFCVYKGVTRGSKSTGKFGRFITANGEVSIRHGGVVFVFEPSSERRAKTEEITKLVRSYYESV